MKTVRMIPNEFLVKEIEADMSYFDDEDEEVFD